MLLYVLALLALIWIIVVLAGGLPTPLLAFLLILVLVYLIVHPPHRRV